ncbi:MAG: hypothetical protein ABI866_01405, partial [Dokdonella sp.]
GQALQGSVRAQLSNKNGTYRVEVYASKRCGGNFNSSGYDDAAVLVGISDPLTMTCATSTMNCDDSIVVPISSDASYPLTGKFLSPVLWDAEHNTSEFGLCLRYVSDEDLFHDGFEGGGFEGINR